MADDAAVADMNNPTSDDDSEPRLNASAAPFTPAPRKPPRRRGA